MQTTLHREGDEFAIVTTAETEDEFRSQFVRALNQVIIDGEYASDEVFVMEEWVKHFSEIICRYRGYKSQVVERKTITAGHIAPDAEQVAISRSLLTEATADNGKVAVTA